jgi:hypothetical protein
MTNTNLRTLHGHGLTEDDALRLSKEVHITKSLYVSSVVQCGLFLGIVFYARRAGVGMYNTMIYNSKEKRIVCADHEYKKATANSSLAIKVGDMHATQFKGA